MKVSRLLFVGTSQDKVYLPRLKPCIGVTSCSVILETPSTFSELAHICKAKNAEAIVSTSPSLLQRLVNSNKRAKPSIDNYAGSIFKLPGTQIEILFIHPLEQLITVPYGQFIATRYISKLTNPSIYLTGTEFNWAMYDDVDFHSLTNRFADSLAIAIDIETFSKSPSFINL